LERRACESELNSITPLNSLLSAQTNELLTRYGLTPQDLENIHPRILEKLEPEITNLKDLDTILKLRGKNEPQSLPKGIASSEQFAVPDSTLPTTELRNDVHVLRLPISVSELRRYLFDVYNISPETTAISLVRPIHRIFSLAEESDVANILTPGCCVKVVHTHWRFHVSFPAPLAIEAKKNLIIAACQLKRENKFHDHHFHLQVVRRQEKIHFVLSCPRRDFLFALCLAVVDSMNIPTLRFPDSFECHSSQRCMQPLLETHYAISEDSLASESPASPPWEPAPSPDYQRYRVHVPLTHSVGSSFSSLIAALPETNVPSSPPPHPAPLSPPQVPAPGAPTRRNSMQILIDEYEARNQREEEL